MVPTSTALRAQCGETATPYRRLLPRPPEVLAEIEHTGQVSELTAQLRHRHDFGRAGEVSALLGFAGRRDPVVVEADGDIGDQPS